MILGFTGTRLGMSSQQRRTLEVLLQLLSQLDIEEVHHGDCVGADEQFHRICQMRKIRIVIHPPDNPRLRANCAGGIAVFPKPYVERNEDIVKAADLIIAAPSGPEQFRGSGTWQTIRRARKWKRPVIIIHAEGGLEYRSAGFGGEVDG